MKRYLCMAAASLAASTVYAQEPGIALNLGYDFGGEELATVIYEDGDKGTVRINEGVNIGVGLALPLGGGVELQSSISYQGVVETATNGEVSWRSYPWETSIVARLGQISVGGGVIYHMSPKFKSEGDLFVGDVEFEDALGYQAQIAYLTNISVADGMALGLKYTRIDFENDLTSITTLNGDNHEHAYHPQRPSLRHRTQL